MEKDEHDDESHSVHEPPPLPVMPYERGYVRSPRGSLSGERPVSHDNTTNLECLPPPSHALQNLKQYGAAFPPSFDRVQPARQRTGQANGAEQNPDASSYAGWWEIKEIWSPFRMLVPNLAKRGAARAHEDEFV